MRLATLTTALAMSGAAFGQVNEPADVAYALHVCTDTVYSVSPGTGGSSADLDPVNQGCLVGGEHLGVWMHFRIATAGQVGFTITPLMPSDYDFAVWGPLTGPVTVLDAPPARCNFSALMGAGGLDFTAQQLSVFAGGAPWCRYLDVEADEWYMLYVDNFSLNGLGFNLTWQLQGGASLGCLAPPEPSFMASATSIEAGSTIDLTDLSTGYPFAWNWSFPGADPSESAEQHPSGVLYALPGCYDVGLGVQSAAGEAQIQELCLIVVEQSTGTGAAGESGFDLRVMPDHIALVNGEGSAFRYVVRDAQGREAASGNAIGSLRLATDRFAPGAYAVQAFVSGSKSVTRRFVK